MPESPYRTAWRTHACGELRAAHVAADWSDDEVAICGHVAARVDDQTFIVRDRYGSALVTASEEALPYVRERAGLLNLEDVVRVTGRVALRAEPDPTMPTGEVQVLASGLEVVSVSSGVPDPALMTATEVPVGERLAMRQLYLRRPDVQARMALRARVAHEAREHLVEEGFLEVETPHLFWYDPVATAPEPIPVGQGKAFALPSGPVVLDQYIKGGQLDRFFQLVRITRRETVRSPIHAQEYTGLDINMSYVDVPDFCAAIEGLLAHVWKAVLGEELPTPFARYSYAEAMRRFGSDKPDLRFGLEVEDAPGAAPGKTVRVVRLEGGALALLPLELNDLLRDAGPPADDDMAAAAPDAGEPAEPAPGTTPTEPARLSWLRFMPNGKLSGEAAALFDGRPELIARVGAREGDVLLVSVAKDEEQAALGAGALRREAGRRLRLADPTACRPCWITDYPLMMNEDGVLVPRVVVFSQPIDDHKPRVIDPAQRGDILARAFDLVLDGVEVGSGYIGNHDQDLQRTIWESCFNMAHADLFRLRAPIEAHRFGVPPHGGMNLGFDRIVARMAGAGAIDEVIPFPKDAACRDPLLDAPGPVPPEAVGGLVEDYPEPSYTIDDLIAEVTAGEDDE